MPPCSVGRIADRRNGGIDAGARLRERGQRRGNHHRRCVFHPDGRRRDSYTHALQNIGEALVRKDGLLAVAFSCEAHYDAIPDQLILANTFDIDEVFQPRGGRGDGKQQDNSDSSHIKKAEAPAEYGREC